MRTMTNLKLLIFSVLFFISAVSFFIDQIKIPHKISIPAFILCFSIPLIERKHMLTIGLALFFSAIGDICGDIDLFIYQVAAFALAHILYIRYFLSSSTKSTKAIWFYAFMIYTFLVAIMLYMLPHITNIVDSIGSIAYSSIIFTMVLSTCLFEGDYKRYFVLASLLFLFSDITLARNKFVGKIPFHQLKVLSTYYGAQFLFWYFSIKRAQKLENGIVIY